MSKGWFIINAQSGKEDIVVNIIDAKKKEGLLNFIHELVVPKHKEVVFKAGKKKTVDKRSFPGYVYINMDMNMENKKEVIALPYVIGFVQEDNKKPIPEPLTDSDFIGVVDDSQSIEIDDSMSYMDFEMNEKVMIIDGALNGFTGTIGDIYKDKKKLMVNVEIFGRVTPVEVDYFKVKKV